MISEYNEKWLLRVMSDWLSRIMRTIIFESYEWLIFQNNEKWFLRIMSDWFSRIIITRTYMEIMHLINRGNHTQILNHWSASRWGICTRLRVVSRHQYLNSGNQTRACFGKPHAKVYCCVGKSQAEIYFCVQKWHARSSSYSKLPNSKFCPNHPTPFFQFTKLFSIEESSFEIFVLKYPNVFLSVNLWFLKSMNHEAWIYFGYSLGIGYNCSRQWFGGRNFRGRDSGGRPVRPQIENSSSDTLL